jgi:tripartite-type tricarboxylate transporter receptor subunit TctC
MPIIVSKVWRFAAIMLALLAVWLSAQSQPQPYPRKPVHLVLGLPAGGGADAIARIVAQGLSETVGQQVVVENRPGASGVIASDSVAKAAPDGYTLLLGGSALTLQPAFGKTLPFDPVKDFAPVSLVADVPVVLIVGATSPLRSVADLVAYAKAHPAQLNYASAGNGSSLHLFMELFKLRTGIQATHVPYKGGVQAAPDLIRGEIQTMFEILPTQISNIKAGKVRALAITSGRRNAQLPDVPTMTELGFNDLEVGVWYGLYAPAGTPTEVVDALHAALAKVLASKPTQDRLAQLGAKPAPSTPSQLAAFQHAEVERWSRVIRSSGATSE